MTARTTAPMLSTVRRGVIAAAKRNEIVAMISESSTCPSSALAPPRHSKIRRTWRA